ncbi:hypothetical protein V5O48_016521 [Marasmius crinis-equi]|uniref:Uncharacterized protein n=1 Tax=Marasmius crinis-equi TaxID=585013 RepID=A0ABR3ERH0_9AGAR
MKNDDCGDCSLMKNIDCALSTCTTQETACLETLQHIRDSKATLVKLSEAHSKFSALHFVILKRLNDENGLIPELMEECTAELNKSADCIASRVDELKENRAIEPVLQDIEYSRKMMESVRKFQGFMAGAPGYNRDLPDELCYMMGIRPTPQLKEDYKMFSEMLDASLPPGYFDTLSSEMQKAADDDCDATFPSDPEPF